MKYTLNASANPAADSHDCIIVPVFSDGSKLTLGEAAQLVDVASTGKIKEILDKGDFKGNSGDTSLLYGIDTISASRILLVGCGKKDMFTLKVLGVAAKASCKFLQNTNIKSASIYLSDEFDSKEQSDQAITQIITTYATCLYQLQDYKSKPKEALSFEQLVISSNKELSKNAETAFVNGTAIAEGMKVSRDLANHPGNVCTPTYMANIAKEVSSDYASIELEILEEADMEKLGMGAFLSVSKGSDEPGKMIILQYQGAADKSEAPIALVGKGVTFDTGGISLKPGASMDEMKFDMSGAACMLGTLKACAEMSLPINIVVVLAAAENMPSGRATKPGDIVTSMQGTTIEVLNTDAEGRLVLCDALTYVGKYKPRIVIDAATLTGACIIALGHHTSAVLSNDDNLAADLISAGADINDPAWQLPMGDEYKKQLKSAFADLGNIGGRAAGTITAACFLGEFTKDYKWAHLDIAGTAWSGKDSTGRPVPLLSQYLINQANR